MKTDEKIDELIDKIIKRTEPNDTEIEETKLMPFRYLTDEDEIQSMLKDEEKPVPFTKMKIQQEVSSIASEEIYSLGDITTIENVIRKHEEIRRVKEKETDEG